MQSADPTPRTGAARVAALYEALERDTRAKTRRYSAAERAVIARFLRDMYDIGVDHVSRLETD